MFCFYMYRKAGTFSSKSKFVSSFYLQPFLSTKSNPENRHKTSNFYLRSLQRCTWHAPIAISSLILQLVRFSAHLCLSHSDRPHTCRDIGPELHPCFAVFLFSRNFTRRFLHVEATGKMIFFHRVPRARPAPYRPSNQTEHSPETSRRRCQNFSLLLPTLWATRAST